MCFNVKIFLYTLYKGISCFNFFVSLYWYKRYNEQTKSCGLISKFIKMF